MGTVELEIGELAMLVTLGNARGGKQSCGACLQAAIASGYTMIGANGDCFPASTFTTGTNFRGNFHNLGSLSSFKLCTRNWISRKCQSGFGCVHPVKLVGDLWRSEEMESRYPGDC